MIDLDKLQALKRAADNHQREADRAAGAVRQLKAELEEKYGVKTLAAAIKLRDAKRKKAGELEAEFDRLLAEFEKDYGERLGCTN